MNIVPTQVFSRHISILILLTLSCCFASAHIAARISFDHGTGLLTAVVFRSGISLLLLSVIAIWQKQSLSMSWKTAPWQLALGLLIVIQSISIYSAVSRIPVGIALLAANTFPAQLALISWALGGQPPTRKVAILMGIILIGLLLALDIPSLLHSDMSNIMQWVIGIGFSLSAAFSLAIGLWIPEHKLLHLKGSTRSFYTLLTVICVSYFIGKSELLFGGITWPTDLVGWGTLSLLGFLYAGAFIMLFMLAPRLDLSQNAPAMNIEPIASLTLGWIILGQALSPMQMVGGVVVVSCIVAFAYTKK